MNNDDSNCAGKPVKSACSPFSMVLLSGCFRFAEEARASSDRSRIQELNSACVMFGKAYWEASFNEIVAISKLCRFPDVPREFYAVLESAEKRLSLPEKWDLWVCMTGGAPWDKANEPFQSYDLISSLRNELVHFKAQFLGKDEAPTKKIRGLLMRFAGATNASFIEDDVSTWVIDLLSSPKLADWVLNSLQRLNETKYDLLAPEFELPGWSGQAPVDSLG